MSLSSYTSELQAIDESALSLREKYMMIRQLLNRICRDLTKEEVLQFPSFFSCLVFVSRKYNLPQKLEWALQTIRVRTAFLLKEEQNLISEQQYKAAKRALTYLLSIIYNGFIEAGFELQNEQSDVLLPLHKLRVQVTAIDRDQKLLTVHTADTPDKLFVKYNVPKTNDIFNPVIERLWIGAQLNLVDYRMDAETNYLIPKYIVLEPDYLIDASAMAECFQNYGRSHLHYFRKKFEPSANSVHILMGNLANFFLDELVYSEHPADLKFDETFLKAFRQSPFEFTGCNDIKEKEDFRLFMSRAKTQFSNIQRVVVYDFPRNGIDTNLCTLEPSFFCETFGFQGRLDLLQLPGDENGIIQIVELKSGGLPFPKDDPGKIALNHETQTAIYRLIIQSVFDKTSREISPMLLYSAAGNDGENLRMPATYHHFEKEIINVRNLIVATEHKLYTGNNPDVIEVFSEVFNVKNYTSPPSFFLSRLASIEDILKNSAEIEQNYFYRYITFLSRELYIQKVGEEGGYQGNANVWTSEFRDRQEAFDLISGLEIKEIDESDRDMKICFKRNDPEHFVNFREGEICILYPHGNEKDTALTNQILKGTVAKIKNTEITVRFRYKQKNKRYLQEHRHWVIEHDKLDHAYNAMYKGLFAFLSSPVEKHRLLLGIDCPLSNYLEKQNDVNELSPDEKREQVVQKATAAQDYFLIVGPPGTGKTSIFARRLIEQFYSDRTCNILVMAYTNRAVDELCEAINQVFGGDDEYIRIGSELSCEEKYRNRLLQNIAFSVQSRDELRTIIRQKRIFVGTLASITGKPELFDMKKFNITIIDEASQILEPQIIGLLPKFDRFIMIGDHKQLSTITLQNENQSKVTDTVLNSIELEDCRESYFERMFRICKKNGWKHAYDTLTYQGRMHNELSNFPNRYFYENRLFPAGEWQKTPLETLKYDANDPYQTIIATNRVGFIPANQQNINHISDKICEEEANISVHLARAIIAVYQRNNLVFDANRTLGIITPYRNQIALIRHKLESTNIPELQDIMVDTVERYQGSQRDIIILSFCMNKPYQLDFFCNLNREKTVDRKLNVAITRARKQLFLTGNELILKQNKIYDSLLSELKVKSYE